jgi:hypothetical protein
MESQIKDPISSYEVMLQELRHILDKFDRLRQQESPLDSDNYNEAFLALLDELSEIRIVSNTR